MIYLTEHGVFLSKDGVPVKGTDKQKEVQRTKTIAYRILKQHNLSGDMERLKLKFDALVSPDNNYVSILQTAMACGMKYFPLPYILTNCHNSLCATGGTTSGDDHIFGLDCVKKYGGIYVPPYQAVLHQYMREMVAGGGQMILGSDSHTRYGVLGTLAVGEGGGELVKQLVGRTYDISCPPVIAVRLTGHPRPGIGPMDVALAFIGAVCESSFIKNSILEFIGEGISGLSVEYRIGIDVMTTESGALSSIWCTDKKVENYLKTHGREKDYQSLAPENGAYYDGMVEIDLSAVECMIALPFHPSNAVSIRNFKEQLPKILKEVEEQGEKIKGKEHSTFSLSHCVRQGELWVDQAVISGCCGGLFENISAVHDIINGSGGSGNGFGLSIHPASQPIFMELMRTGIAEKLVASGITIKPAICGPCFGTMDIPADNQLSIRHTTRNYPGREGSRTDKNQMAATALMDSRSIAATMRCGGRLTAATETDVKEVKPVYYFNSESYKKQVVDYYKKGNPSTELRKGPGIADWPRMYPLEKHVLLCVAGVYDGTLTTDELLPSGEISAFRSNPERIAEYTLMGKDKDYVERAKAIRRAEQGRRQYQAGAYGKELTGIMEQLCRRERCTDKDIMIGSIIVGKKIGEGSSREQAASCQRTLGGLANLSNEYAAKRYRSNLINWGILPLEAEQETELKLGDWIFIKDIKSSVKENKDVIFMEICGERGTFKAHLGRLTKEEQNILLSGGLINYYGQ